MDPTHSPQNSDLNQNPFQLTFLHKTKILPTTITLYSNNRINPSLHSIIFER